MKNILLLTQLILGSAIALSAQTPTETLPYRENLDYTLTENGAVNATPPSFLPEKDFSIGFAAQFPTGTSSSLQLTAANTNGYGFNIRLSESKIENAGNSNSLLYSIPDNDGKQHSFRLVVHNEDLLIYRDKELVSQNSAASFGKPAFSYINTQNDGENTGIYSAANLISNPGFETEDIVLANSNGTYKFWPADWKQANADSEEKQAMGVRCNKNDELYANGREGSSALMFRQDGSGGFSATKGSYVYQQLHSPLQPGRKYLLTFQVLSHTNDLGKTYAVGVGSAQGDWDYFHTTWTAPANKQTLQTYQYEFIAPATAGTESYLAFICYGSTGICHIDRVTLEEATGVYNRFTLQSTADDIIIGATTYSPQALSPEKKITNRIVAGGEYHLYHTQYSRVLGEKEDGNTPGLSVLGTNATADSYVFVTESSDSEGYYLLRQKSSGRYLTVSTTSTNTWSVYLTQGHSTADNYLWSVQEGTQGYISSKYNKKYLGCDTGKDGDTYISVFYDKSIGEYSTWQIVEAAFTLDEARLQLYMSKLKTAIDTAQELLDNTAYSEESKAAIRSSLPQAQEAYDNASIEQTELMNQVTTALNEANEACIAANSVVWFSGYDFIVKDQYTVALNGVTRKAGSTGDVSLIIRNTQQQGAVIKLNTQQLTIGDTTLPIPAEIQNEEEHSYLFSYNNGTITAYVNKQSIGNVPAYTVTAQTAIGTQAEFSALGIHCLTAYRAELVSSTQALTPDDEPLNEYGKTERHTAYIVNQQLTINEPVDLHILSENAPLTGSVINLNHEDAWLIFDNTLPSDVVSKYLSSIRVNGAAASMNKNVRVVIYLQGTAVLPHSNTYKPFSGYSGELYAGETTEIGTGNANLGKKANVFSSFTLKRGYMVCLATNKDGSGYSRVFVADHEDIQIPVLPEALNRRISYVNVKKWNYVSKKGWCSTKGSSAIATDCKKLRTTWFYTWSADRQSTYDTEYVPIKQHLYWPSWSQINGLTDCTHVLGLNEPEHAEQHTKDQCSCGGVINEWNACVQTTEFQQSGMRIGSPAPTDASWLTKYIGHCDDMAYRCDFVVMHCYWGTNEAADAQAWYNRLKDIHNKTKRPIWITEWNNGASWTTESWPSGYGERLEKNRKAIKEILNVLDTCSFVERYSIYNWDSYYRAMIADDGWVTPAGEVYRDNKPTFAYNAKVQYIPHWWAPSLKDVTITGTVAINNSQRTLTFISNNPNNDMTDRFIIQRKLQDDTWEDIYEETDRSLFDNTELTHKLSLDGQDWENAQTFRLHITTLKGETTNSPEININIPTGINVTENNYTTIWQDGEYVHVKSGATQAYIYSMSGALITNCDISQKTDIDISRLPRGYYLLKTNIGEQFTIIR